MIRSHSLAPFVCDLNYARLPFAWNEARRVMLDDWYARTYGLTRDKPRSCSTRRHARPRLPQRNLPRAA